MKKIILNITLFASIFVLINACGKEKFDGPDTDGCVIETPTGTAITIQELKNKSTGEITEDLYIEGTVTADDKSGNFYKKIHLQDSTAAIAVNIDRTNFYSLFPEGRNVYVSLKGLHLNNSKEVVANAAGDRILSAEVDKYLKRGACFKTVKADTVSISDLNDSYLYKLVTIAGVEVVNAPSGITYANAVTKQTENLNVSDCSHSLILRNSGYAKFAADTVPTGNGYITGIYSKFNSDQQIFIRNTEDMNLTGARCDGNAGGGGTGSSYLSKDFEDNNLTSGGWTTQQVTGSTNWVVGTYGGKYYAEASNYNAGSNTAAEVWLISPAIDLSASTTPILNFRSAYKYTGPTLEVFVSTDYSGSGNPTTATWTALSPTLSPGNFTWTDSGDLPLPQSATTYVAFKYTGTNSNGSKWEVDNILVKES